MMTLRHFALASLTLLVFALASKADPVPLEDAFALTTRSSGDRYQLARDLLAREGQRIVPFLQAKLKSDDWHQRDVAAALLARIAHPVEARELERIRNGYANTWQVLKDDTLRIRFSKEEADWHLRNKQPAPVPSIVITPAMIPLLHEIFRVESEWGTSYQRGADPVVALLADWRAVDSIPVILRWRSKMDPRGETLIPNLVKMGPKAVPILRDAVRAGDKGAPIAACTLAGLGDAELAPLFIERLNDVKLGAHHWAYARALSELKVLKGLPALFDALERAADAERKLASSSNRAAYDELRADVLAYGNLAIPELRLRGRAEMPLASRVLAQALLWRLEHPAAWAKLKPLLEAQMSVHASRVGFHGQRGEAWNVDEVFADHTAKRLNWPAALRLEYGYVHADPFNLTPLGLMKGEPLAFDVLASTLKMGRFSAHTTEFDLLASLQDERAVDIYKKLVQDENYWYYEGVPGWLLSLNSKKGIPVLDDLLGRIAKDRQGEKDPTQQKRLAALVPVVNAVKAALNDDRAALVKLLDDPALRRIAAVCLARKRDVRAIPALVQALTAKDESEFYTFGPGHRQRGVPLDGSERGLIVSMGAEALPILAKLQKESTDRTAQLFCESLRLRIEQPKLAYKYQAACDAGMARVYMPMIPDFYGGGAIVASAVGKPAVPLLEASLAMGTDLHPICAAYALGSLGEERSIDVIVKAMPSLWSHRGFVGGSFLAMFGPKGIEVAKKIPPPDPRKPNYHERAMRSRGGTEALVQTEDPKGIDNILEFFNRPVPKKGTPEHVEWAARVDAYLKMSQHYDDTRFVEPIMKLLDVEGNPFELRVYETLLLYKEPRLLKRALGHLGKLPKEYWESDKILNFLAVQLEEDLPATLIKTYRAAKDDKTRDDVLYALERMSTYPYGYAHWRADGLNAAIRRAQSVYQKQWGRTVFDHIEQKHDETAEFLARAKEAQLMRRQEELEALRAKVQYQLPIAAVDLLKDALDQPITPESRPRVMRLLRIVGYGSYDKKGVTIKPLIAWLKAHDPMPEPIVKYLYYVHDPIVTDTFIEMFGKWSNDEEGEKVRRWVTSHLEYSKNPKATEIILKLYRAGGRSDPDFARVLGERGVKEAIDDLAHHAKHNPCYSVIHALSTFGKPGQERVLAAYHAQTEMSNKWTILIALSHHGYAPKRLFDDFSPYVRSKMMQKALPEGRANWGYVSTYADSIARVDPVRTYALLAECFFQTPNDDTQRQIIDYLRRMESRQASLRYVRIGFAK